MPTIKENFTAFLSNADIIPKGTDISLLLEDDEKREDLRQKSKAKFNSTVPFDKMYEEYRKEISTPKPKKDPIIPQVITEEKEKQDIAKTEKEVTDKEAQQMTQSSLRIAKAELSKQNKNRQVLEGLGDVPNVTGNRMLDVHLAAKQAGFIGSIDELKKIAGGLYSGTVVTPSQATSYFDNAKKQIEDENGVLIRGGNVTIPPNETAYSLIEQGADLVTQAFFPKEAKEDRVKDQSRLDKAKQEFDNLRFTLLDAGVDHDVIVRKILGEESIDEQQKTIELAKKSRSKTTSNKVLEASTNPLMPPPGVEINPDDDLRQFTYFELKEGERLIPEDVKLERDLKAKVLNTKTQLFTDAAERDRLTAIKYAEEKGLGEELNLYLSGAKNYPEVDKRKLAYERANKIIEKSNFQIKQLNKELKDYLGEYSKVPDLISFLEDLPYQGEKEETIGKINGIAAEIKPEEETIKQLGFEVQKDVMEKFGFHLSFEQDMSVPQNVYNYLMSDPKYFQRSELINKLVPVYKELSNLEESLNALNENIEKEVTKKGWLDLYNKDFITEYNNRIGSEEYQNIANQIKELSDNPEAKAIIKASDKEFQAFLKNNPEAKSYIDAVSKISESGILDSKEMKRLKYYEDLNAQTYGEFEKLPIEYADAFFADKLNKVAQIKHDKLVQSSGWYNFGARMNNLLAGDVGSAVKSIAMFPATIAAAFGSEYAQSLMIEAASNDYYSKSTKNQRSATQHINKVVLEAPLMGIGEYEVAVNRDNNIIGIYDSNGYQVFHPETVKKVAESYLESGLTYEDSKLKFNRGAISLGASKVIVDFGAMMLLSSALRGSFLGKTGRITPAQERLLEAGSVMPVFQYSIAESLMKEGMSPRQASQLAIPLTALEMATEAMFPLATRISDNLFFKASLGQAWKDAGAKAAIKALATRGESLTVGEVMTFGRNWAKAIGLETLEEYTSEYFSPYITNAYEMVDPSVPLTSKISTLDEYRDLTAITIAGMAFIGAGNAYIETANLPMQGIPSIANPKNSTKVSKMLEQLVTNGSITVEQAETISENVKTKLNPLYDQIQTIGNKSVEAEQLREFILRKSFVNAGFDQNKLSDVEKSLYTANEVKITQAKDLLRNIEETKVEDIIKLTSEPIDIQKAISSFEKENKEHIVYLDEKGNPC